MGKIYNLQNFEEENVEVFCEVAKYDPNKIRRCTTSFIDESKDVLEVNNDDSIRGSEEVGEVAHTSANGLLKMLCIAIFAWFDLLRAVDA